MPEQILLKSKKNFIDIPLLHFRVIKISIAVFITLLITSALGIKKPIFPALAAGLCIKPTFFGGLKHGFNEIKITVITAFITAGLLEFFYLFIPRHELTHDFLTVIVLAVSIAYCMSKNHYELISIAMLTSLYISIESASDHFITAAMIRKAAIIIGIAVAAIVNGLFISKQYKIYFEKRLKEITENTFNLFSDTIEAFIYFNKNASEKIMDRVDNFLNYMYGIRTKTENIAKELKLRRKIKGFSELKMQSLKEIIYVYISILHHTENIAQAVAILNYQTGHNGFKKNFYGLFSKFEENLLAMTEMLIDNFEIINESVKNKNPALLQKINADTFKDINTLFKDIAEEIKEEGTPQRREILLELIAIGRNMRDIGINLRKLQYPINTYYCPIEKKLKNSITDKEEELCQLTKD